MAARTSDCIRRGDNTCDGSFCCCVALCMPRANFFRNAFENPSPVVISACCFPGAGATVRTIAEAESAHLCTMPAAPHTNRTAAVAVPVLVGRSGR